MACRISTFLLLSEMRLQQASRLRPDERNALGMPEKKNSVLPVFPFL